MRLFETGLAGQAEAGQFAFVDALPKSFAQIFLQRPELHAESIASVYSVLLFKNRRTSESKYFLTWRNRELYDERLI